jgi:MtrB/PioB family decaheme-associated outer membrane protein
MRNRATTLLLAMLLVPTGLAYAQDEKAAGDQPAAGSVDFGGQFTTTKGDEGRYERYKDLRTGGLLDAFLYHRATDAWQFNASARHVGYRDQRYLAQFWKYDRAKITFMWDQIPLTYGVHGERDPYGFFNATPYTGVGSSEYRLDDGVQAQLQAVCPDPATKPCTSQQSVLRQTLLYNLVGPAAQSLDIRTRRDIALVDASIRIVPHAALLLHFQNTTKTGLQPWSASYGFSGAVELPAPVDTRSTDFGAALQFSNEKGMVKAGWDGSWFHNNVGTLTWDNPLRITDTTYGSAYTAGDGTSQGRQDLWPDSSTSMWSGTATYALPWHGRVYGNLGFSTWDQNDALLPFTINTSIPVIPLDRTSAEAKADITTALVGVSARPTDRLWMNVRYKLYDYDNKTPHFGVVNYVRFDQVIEPFASDAMGTEAFSYKRQYTDADLSYRVAPFTAVRVGYSREGDRRTFRQFENTTDNIFKVALDTTGWQFATLRVQYDYAKRTGTGLEEEVFDAENEGFAEARQFDISDRNRKRGTFLATFTPSDLISVDAQVGIFREDRPQSEFGLLSTDGDFYSIGVNLTPVQSVAFGVNYGKDKYKTLQKSRQANPGAQEQDPTRDWTTDYKDDVDTIYAYVDLPKLIPRATVRYSFDWMDGANDITYGLRPDQTIFTTVPLLQLPGSSQTTTRSNVDVNYRMTKRLGAGFGWYYEDYQISDWGWNDCGIVCSGGTPTVKPSPTTTVDGPVLNPPNQAGTSAQFLSLLRYVYRPYTGNTVYVRLRYFF